MVPPKNKLHIGIPHGGLGGRRETMGSEGPSVGAKEERKRRTEKRRKERQREMASSQDRIWDTAFGAKSPSRKS